MACCLGTAGGWVGGVEGQRRGGGGRDSGRGRCLSVPYLYAVPSAVETVSHDVPHCRFYKPVDISMQSAVPSVGAVGVGGLGC